MEKELQGKLVEILTSVQSAVGKASDFAIGQLPDIAQSYVAYGRAAAISGVLLGFLLIAGGCFGVRIGMLESQKSYAEENSALTVLGVILGGVAIFIGLLVTVFGVQEVMLVWFAPKVWLLKELAHLVK